MPVPSCVRARASADAVEALEDVRQLVCRDARAGVAHREFDVLPTPGQADGDLAREGELEGVREQVEDDLLPHLAVDVDGLGERRAVDHEAQAGTLDGGAKDAGEFGGERGQIGGFIRRPGCGPPRCARNPGAC